MSTPLLLRGSFAALAGWGESSLDAAFAAFRLTAPRLLVESGSASPLALDPGALADAAHAALEGTASPREFFESRFEPARVALEEPSRGFVTGYYELVVEASPTRTERFKVPLHRPPPDLVRLGADRPAGLDPELAFARKAPDGALSEHFDRAAVSRGALDGDGLEIAWLADPVDAFFIHVQGSARLRLTDGGEMRVGYAAKSGHRFTAIGRVLVSNGELVLEKADMAGIRDWLASHPDEVRRLLDRNRSYIYFEPREIADPAAGPVGAAGASLTPLASLAIDPLFHRYGTPIFVDAPGLLVEARPFRRLLVAQDTGSAIVGAARGDIFVGSGAAAGALAGTVRHLADFHVLVPRNRSR